MIAANTMDTYRVSYHGYAHSHIDALCHILYKGQTYNGYATADVNTATAAPSSAIDNLKQGVITRGILIDIPRLSGVPYLEPGTRDLSPKTSKPGRRRPASRSARATPSSCAPADGRGATRSGRGPSAATPPASTPRSRRGSRRAAWRSSAATPRRTSCRRWSRASRCRCTRCSSPAWASTCSTIRISKPGRHRGEAESLGVHAHHRAGAGDRRHRLAPEYPRDVLIDCRSTMLE